MAKHRSAVSKDDLTEAAIIAFLLPVDTGESEKSRKEVLREAFLRFHPEEREAVWQGIGRVAPRDIPAPFHITSVVAPTTFLTISNAMANVGDAADEIFKCQLPDAGARCCWVPSGPDVGRFCCYRSLIQYIASSKQESSATSSANLPLEFSESLFGRLPPLMRTKEPELLDKIGLGAVTYLRFLRLMWWLSFAGIAVPFYCQSISPIIFAMFLLRAAILSMLTIRDVPVHFSMRMSL
ncbi:hypothetical protein Agabi119p4_1097 [Agaricus bisporus var. burnettii]|uniref:CSC1/OSCA1-like N-terminal transmembrane domain-containing protein n=1 Tax=Agaricus bisporus var. burnettii TaxID=192524 RepID=A0A8H7KLN4_AGABI|nr:hypothetical protein Agabi119p4_1097 [Agaricus bisporus var. burnettii]